MIISASRRTDIPAFYAEWRRSPRLAEVCTDHGMDIVSCAGELDLVPYGVTRGKCIDDELIRRLFGINVCHKKNGAQRPACGRVQSRDIEIYNSCVFGCVYCYATSSFTAAAANHRRHDPDSAALIPFDASGPAGLGY